VSSHIKRKTAIRHPERSEVLLREPKRADAKPAQRAGIYEGVFVTFHRQSYFPFKKGTSLHPTIYLFKNLFTLFSPKILKIFTNRQKNHENTFTFKKKYDILTMYV